MFRIDNQSRRSVYEQIGEQVEKYILAGILNSGDKLPSVRKLSTDLHINPNTVQRAYTELERSKVLATQPGRGAFVAQGAYEMLQKRTQSDNWEQLKRVVMELKLAKVTEKDVLEVVKAVYKGGTKDD